MDYKVKDIALAEQGELSIEWAQRNMPVLADIEHDLLTGVETPP